MSENKYMSSGLYDGANGAFGNASFPPGRFILTGGQKRDITQAEELIAGYGCEYVIANVAHDSQGVLQSIGPSGAVHIIPIRPSRGEQHSYDEHLYRKRHLVECFFGKIKHYRRISSRFEKLASTYLGSLISLVLSYDFDGNVNTA